MIEQRRKKNLIVGNWKMNQERDSIVAFFQNVTRQTPLQADRWIAPQAIHLSLCQSLAPSDFKIGAQNCSWEKSGALTGEISPQALTSMGATFVILGHSERRSIFHESDATIAKKVKMAIEQKLQIILCVGETLSEREANETEQILAIQLTSCLKELSARSMEQIIIAYEPVWAIGTGKTATPEMAQSAHAFIRKFMTELGHDASDTPILYGGSVKPDNIKALLACPDIDGALVGGASLKAEDFNHLCAAR